VGLELGQNNLREKFDLLCLALLHSTDEAIRHNPRDSEVVKGNTVLAVMGDVDNVCAAHEATRASRLS